MEGRLEHSLNIESTVKKILQKYNEKCLYDFYYSLASVKEPTTVRNYIRNAAKFICFIRGSNADFHIEELERRHIDLYMSSIRYIKKDGKIKAASDSYRATIWSVLNCFVKFLKNSGYIEYNIMADVERPKVKDDVERVFMDALEIREVLIRVQNLYICSRYNEGYVGWEARDATILSFLIKTGMRITALTEINEEDIDFKSGVIKIVDKRRKVHEYPLDDTALDIAKEWNNCRKEILRNSGVQDTGAFFISHYRKRISARTVNRIIEEYTDFIPKKITAHKIRGSYATNLYNATGDIYFVKECMGHKSVDTTQIYLKPDNASRKEALNIMNDMLNKTD